VNVCTFDIESTGIDALCCEIITAYFFCTEFDNYDYKSQVDNWSDDAAKIHKISEMEMLSFAPKKAALGGLYLYLDSLPKDTLFVCYANSNQRGEFYFYDKAAIMMSFELHGHKFDMSNIVSGHSMAKEAHKRNLFTPNKRLSEKGRLMNDFTQSGVFEALFGYKFSGSHTCYGDVMALCKIYNELEDVLKNNRIVGNREQLELF
jgi:hypothetical protein